MIRKLSAVAISAATALFATSALAQDPAAAPAPAPAPAAASASSSDSSDSSGGVSAALLLGYGFDDAFKLGFGARAGYTLPQAMGPGHLYLGGTFVYHLGTSITTGVDSSGNPTSSSVGVYYVNAEGGYEVPAGPVVIRPFVGLGYLGFHGFPSAQTIDGITVGGAPSGKIDFQLGATLLYPVAGAFSIGDDARFVVVSDYNTFNLFLTAQYHF